MAATTRRFVPRRRHVGLLLMLVGATSVLAGLVETTASSAVSQNCPVGATLLAKFQYAANRYELDGPDANRNVMTIEDGTAAGANWHSTIAVSYVVVAGGPGAVTTSLDPMLYASRFSNNGLPNTDGTTPDITGVQFCRPDTSSTTTTTSADTTTTDPSSSTTDLTSTNHGAASTTVLPNSSTSAPAPSTASPSRATALTTALTTATISAPTTATTLPATHVTLPASIAAQSPAPTTSTTAVKNTVPVPTTTVAGATTTTTVNPNSTGSTIPTTISPGGATSTSVYAVLAGLPIARLPRTGSSSSPLIAIGIVLLGTGLGIAVVGSRRERGRA
jgi:LPXTG-motif cell wall-anchored protein